MILRFCILTLLIYSGFSSLAKEVAGIELEELARLSVGNTELVLNGSGVKLEAQHAIYVGGLYLKQQTDSYEQIISDQNPKRFLFYCNTNAISGEKLVSAWEQGFAINYSGEQFMQLQPMINEFYKVWQAGLVKGDEVWVDFIPGQGTKISKNGVLVTEIPGDEFYNAFLKTWLGPRPFNLKIKEALLGR